MGTPLKNWDINIYRGILTGYNEAFIIDQKTRDELIAASPKNDEIIRPILRGRDIPKYKASWSNLYLINTHTGYRKVNSVKVEDYPEVKSLLDKNYPILAARSDKGVTPYHLRSCIYMEDFFKPKIVWGEISDTSKFYYDDANYFVEATSFLMTGEKLKYLLGLLNSKLMEWYFNQIGTATGLGTNRWKKYTIELLPIKYPDSFEQEKIENYVKKIIISKDQVCLDLLDKYVLEIFKLSPDEISYFESNYMFTR